MKKKFFCVVTGLSLFVCLGTSHIYAYDFAGNEDEWLSKCSISQETQEEAQACKAFKKYYQGLQSDVENEIGKLENQSAKVVDNIDELEKLVNQQSDIIKDLDKQVAANEATISKIAGQIVKLDKDIAIKEKNIEERDKLIKSRMVNDQVHVGTNENIEILMGAKDLMDLIRKVEGLQKITDNDQIEIQKIQKEKEELNLDKNEKQRLKQNEEDAKVENEKNKKSQEKLKASREKLLNQYRKQEADLYEKVRNVKADASVLQNNMIHINTSVAQKIDYNKEKGMHNVALYDVSNTHVSQLISETFKYSHLVLASVTYNLGIYPVMHNFLMDMKALNVQKRVVGIIENGSWAPKSGSLMKECLDEMKQMSILNEELSFVSSMNDANRNEMDALVDGILDSMKDA